MSIGFDLNGRRGGLSADWRTFVASAAERAFGTGATAYKRKGTAVSKLWVVCNESVSSLSEARGLLSSAEVLQSWLGEETIVCVATIDYPGSMHRTEEMLGGGVSSFASLLDFAKTVSPGDYVVFLGPCAELECQFFAKLVERALCEAAGLVLFDLWYEEDGIAYPVLMGGIDAVAIDYCDYIFSTFIVRGDVLTEAVGDAPPSLSPWGLSKRVISRSLALDSFNALYMQLPLVRDDGIRLKFLHEKERLIGLDFAMQRRYQDLAVRDRSETRARIAAIICTKDKCHLLSQLVRGLAMNWDVTEIVIVSNNPVNRYSKETLNNLSAIDKVSIVEYAGDFNFSEQCNLGVSKTASPRLLFLNDDIVPINPNWLESLNDVLDRFPFVGAVGSLLLYPNETVQHGGMYLGFNNCAGHEFRGATLPDDGYLYRCLVPRSASCVTGAVMLVERAVFDALNGFDRKLATYLQDVDLCQRINGLGKKVVFTPLSKLFHMESVSLSNEKCSSKLLEKRGLEHQVFFRRWGGRKDDYRSGLFDIQSEGNYRMIV